MRAAAPGELPPASEFQAQRGAGVLATVDNRKLAIGNRALIQRFGIAIVVLDEAARRHESQGHTVVFVADTMAPRLLGALVIADRPRARSAAAMAALKTAGIATMMLSGDNRATAQAIASRLGIDDVKAEVTPERKAETIDALKIEGRNVVMVGDGVNDAPALAAANVGIAMGGGSDVALAAAHVALLREEPLLVPQAIALAQRIRRKIGQNLFWAFVYNIAAVPLAALGLLDPVIAGAAMALSSVSVVFNALTLRWSKERTS
jgi:Cu+-exporting ATPase